MRQIAFLNGLLSIALLSSGCARSAPKNNAVVTSQALAAKAPRRASIEGTWKQYEYEGATPYLLGTFVVSKQRDRYVMSAQEQTESSEVRNSIGILNVAYDGTKWTFDSNLGKGTVAHFTLYRVSDTVFKGESSIQGDGKYPNKWVKVG